MKIELTKLLLILVFIVSLIASCTLEGYSKTAPIVVEAPAEIRTAAYTEAERYIDMDYEYGGQDFPAKGIDCSGLIVNVYYTSVKGTEYRLLFTDSNVHDLFTKYTENILSPDHGDLVFMGEENSNEITHVAILNKIENGTVYFIDSTYNEQYRLNGVSYRSYSSGNSKIKSYGRMLLEKY